MIIETAQLCIICPKYRKHRTHQSGTCCLRITFVDPKIYVPEDVAARHASIRVPELARGSEPGAEGY
jgi:hypothetical protein